MRDVMGYIGTILFIVGVIALLVFSTSYNHDSQKTCESIGYTMVRVYETGEYGCASVVSFEEVAGR